jgi:hypothetical protein
MIVASIVRELGAEAAGLAAIAAAVAVLWRALHALGRRPAVARFLAAVSAGWQAVTRPWRDARRAERKAEIREVVDEALRPEITSMRDELRRHMRNEDEATAQLVEQQARTTETLETLVGRFDELHATNDREHAEIWATLARHGIDRVIYQGGS